MSLYNSRNLGYIRWILPTRTCKSFTPLTNEVDSGGVKMINERRPATWLKKYQIKIPSMACVHASARVHNVRLREVIVLNDQIYIMPSRFANWLKFGDTSAQMTTSLTQPGSNLELFQEILLASIRRSLSMWGITHEIKCVTRNLCLAIILSVPLSTTDPHMM